MAIAKKTRDPFEILRKMNEEMRSKMNSLFYNVWEPSFSPSRDLNIRKAISDVEDTGKEVLVRVELPGVDKKDIIIKSQDNQLEVSVKKKQEASVKKKNYLYEERSYTGFYRSLTLPIDADTSKISAKYSNGLLSISMPKKKLKTGKRIRVK